MNGNAIAAAAAKGLTHRSNSLRVDLLWRWANADDDDGSGGGVCLQMQITNNIEAVAPLSLPLQATTGTKASLHFALSHSEANSFPPALKPARCRQVCLCLSVCHWPFSLIRGTDKSLTQAHKHKLELEIVPGNGGEGRREINTHRHTHSQTQHSQDEEEEGSERRKKKR